jgi:hypothetical protein
LSRRQGHGNRFEEHRLMAAGRGQDAVLLIVDSERTALREELRVLDDVAKLLRGSKKDHAAQRNEDQVSRKKPRHRRQQGSRRSSAAIAKRDREMLRFLRDHGPAEAGPIQRAFPGVGPKGRLGSLRRLEGQGLVSRSGPPNSPTYAAVGGSDGFESHQPQAETLGGRLLAFIQEQNGASMAELIATTGATETEIRLECGQLLRQGEVARERRDDEFVYVPVVSA